MMNRFFRRPPFDRGLSLAGALVFSAALGAQTTAAGVDGPTLAEQLRELARVHGFTLQGIDVIADAPAIRTSGDLGARLRALLGGYNHVVEGAPPDVSRVIIVGPRTPAVAGFSLKTTRNGSHHSVAATLHGMSGHRLSADLVVDTGASSVVLPASMMRGLGYRAADLPDQETQTVNGRLTGKSARLSRVSVGGASAGEVDVLFVPDDRLGGTNLLGMSFLERFTLTIHDADSRLVLTPR